MKTYPLFKRRAFWHAAASDVFAQHKSQEGGKDHRYFSVVENRRVGTKRRTVQRTVLHLVEAHIMVAFLAYCLMVTLKNRPTAAGW